MSRLFERLFVRFLIGALMVGAVVVFSQMGLGKDTEAYAGLFCCGSLALVFVFSIFSDRQPKRP